MTSASFTDPPGSTQAVTPASARRRRPSGKGKKASEAAQAPLETQATPEPKPEEPLRQQTEEEKKPGGGIITRIYDIFKF